jgi:hypothetical protein
LNSAKFLFLSAWVLVLGMLAGCGRSTVSTRFNAPEFSLAELRDAPSLLVVAPEVRLRAYHKPYRALFGDSSALSERISRKMLDSLKLRMPVSAAPAATDSALRALLASTGSRHVIVVRSAAIEDTARENPDVLLPGIGGMQPAGRGTSHGCVVTLEVEILDAALTRRYAFTARARSEVVLYAYKTALAKAVDAAALRAASHLSGR